MGLIINWLASIGERFQAASLVLRKKFPSLPIINHASYSQDTGVSNEIVSLMFVDVSGFSLVAENLTPIQTYEVIRPVMDLVISEVEKHGGIIDKTMGDGLFAYFRDHNGTFKQISHADRALDCGIEIQKRMMRQTLESQDDYGIMPLRIGINTASVCIGKLGQERYHEFAIFGRGVNFAQRLEQACDIFSVMASDSTVELATKYAPSTVGLSRKIIKPKHQHDVITVFEIDPFTEDPLLREKAIEKFRVSRKLQRREERIHIPKNSVIEFKCDFGEVRLVDFSTGGLSVALNKYLAKNVDFCIPVASTSHQISEELLSRGIDRLWLKIKWGKVEDDNYIHGAQFLNLSESQREFIFHCLEDHLFSDQQNSLAS